MEKKILFLGMTANYGGLETFMMNIFRSINSSECRFDFIKDFSKGKIAYEEEIKNNGGKIQVVPIMDNKNRRPLIKYSIRKRLVKNFFRKHHDYSIIHINALNINGVIFWIREAKKYNIKIVLHLHLDKLDNTIENIGRKITAISKIKSSISKLMTKINLRYINRNHDIIKLAASNNAGNYFFGVNKFNVIHNGIEVDKYKFCNDDKINVKKNLQIEDDYKIIITVARISRQKNYEKIVDVFREIKQLNKKIKLVVVGEGELSDEIVSRVNHYGLDNDVYFLGTRNDVNVLLSAADLILMPSLLEAFPFALVESQAAGVPGLVSKGVIPQEENITGKLTYFSLEKNDLKWAKAALDILDKNLSSKDRVEMFNSVNNSEYNLHKSIREIKKIYELK